MIAKINIQDPDRLKFICTYNAVDKIIPLLTAEDFDLDEKGRNVTLTEEGVAHCENALQQAGLMSDGSLYDINHVGLLHQQQL